MGNILLLFDTCSCRTSLRYDELVFGLVFMEYKESTEGVDVDWQA